LRAAKGNSGVILSQILRGLADATDPGRPGGFGPAELVRGLRDAVRLAYAAVQDPQDGTILSVLSTATAALDAGPGAAVPPRPDASAASIERFADPAGFGSLVEAVAGAGRAALERTPTQLAELREAGVVDSGGLGLVLLLDALVGVVTGRMPTDWVARPIRAAVPDEVPRETGSDRFAYEIQYLLEDAASETAVAELRECLSALGDSLVIVGGPDGTWNVHVHTNEIGAAIEAGVAAGRPRSISVVRFADQRSAASMSERAERLLVALTPTKELAQLFAGAGVLTLAALDASEIAERAARSGAAGVVLLPGRPATASVAVPGDPSADEQAAAEIERLAEALRAQGLSVASVPTRSPVQALAAIAVHDPARRADDDLIAMAEAAAATHFAEVTVAQVAGLTTVGPCRPGDVLGLIDGDVVDIGASEDAVATAVLDRLLGTGGELVTILLGAAATPTLGPALEQRVRTRAPFTEVAVFQGGELGCSLVIGME